MLAVVPVVPQAELGDVAEVGHRAAIELRAQTARGTRERGRYAEYDVIGLFHNVAAAPARRQGGSGERLRPGSGGQRGEPGAQEGSAGQQAGAAGGAMRRGVVDVGSRGSAGGRGGSGARARSRLTQPPVSPSTHARCRPFFLLSTGSSGVAPGPVPTALPPPYSPELSSATEGAGTPINAVALPDRTGNAAIATVQHWRDIHSEARRRTGGCGSSGQRPSPRSTMA